MGGMKLSQLAGMWSNDPSFIRFLNVKLDDTRSADRFGVGGVDPADYIREVCSIKSRRELDTDARAAAIFNRDIRIPFMEWAREEQGIAKNG